MKVVFRSGEEAQITERSSIYALEINTKDEQEIASFKALLTNKNLSEFAIVDDNRNVKYSGHSMIYIKDSEASIDSDSEFTCFTLRDMTDAEKRVVELEAELETQADAIAELAQMISEQ